MGKTIAIETFALEQLDDCEKNEPYIKKRLSFNEHQRWPHECPRQLLTLQGLSEMGKTHHIAYAQINSKF